MGWLSISRSNYVSGLTGWIKDGLNRTMIAAPPVVGKIAISNDDC